MERIHGGQAAGNQCIGCGFVGGLNLQVLDCESQHGEGFGTALLIRNATDLEVQGVGGHECHVAGLNGREDCKDGFSLNPDPGLSLIVEGPLKAAGVKVDAHGGDCRTGAGAGRLTISAYPPRAADGGEARPKVIAVDKRLWAEPRV